MGRFYEMLPGILSWATLLLMAVLSWKTPFFIAVFIIFFDIYWLLKTVYLSFHLRTAFNQMRRNLQINWLEKLRVSNLPYEDIYHLVILPMYKEPCEVVEESFRALSAVNYPKEKLIVVLAIEKRAENDAQITAQKIKEKFGENFFRFITTVHPDNLPEEIPGKGSNESWAAQEVKKIIIDPLKIPYENILVSVFDIDTQILPNYFGILAYHFLTCPFPQRSSFQPVPLFTNNIFQAPSFARVISFSATFWHMIQQSRPHRLTTFSSHSMPFKALVEIGFWNKNIVSEDSQIFWQCYIHYSGDWRVVPIHYPLSMDANAAPTFWQTIINQYKQQRRWAWGGCENIPYMLKNFRRNKKITFKKKFVWSFNYIEGFHSWATNTLIIFILGWLPIVIGGAEFRFSLLSYNLPKITSYIMDLSMVGIITSAILSVILLPPRPKWFKKRHYALYFFQWLLMPLTMIFFGAFPALDAQTRAILGGKFKLGFWITPKYRQNLNLKS